MVGVYRSRRRFSGVALGLGGFACGIMVSMLAASLLPFARVFGDRLLQLHAISGLFVAALTLGLASRFDRLRTDGGRVELFPKDDVAPAPLPAAALLDEAATAAAFVKEQARESRNT